MKHFRKSLVLAVLVLLCPTTGFAQEVVRYNYDYLGLLIISQPSGADVTINGKAMGKTPLRLERGGINNRGGTENTLGRIDVGDARNFVISFSKQGYEDCARAIKIELSNNTETNYPVINATLEKLPEPVKPVVKDTVIVNTAPAKNPQQENVVRWKIQSDPNGARIFWRIISSTQEVKSTNENFLASTPYEETRAFNILGLTYENSTHVTLELKVTKRGYVEQIKRFNLRMALDQQEINSFFELYEE